MSASFELPDVDRFVAGAIGEPGQRTFFLQIAAGTTLISLKCEKIQVASLAEHFSTMLRDLPEVRSGHPSVSTPEMRLETPVLAEWAVGAIGLGYDSTNDRIMIVFHEVQTNSAETDDAARRSNEDDDEAGRARCLLTRAQAAAFIEHAGELVARGRPVCVLCGAPIDPDGYNCACYN